jgi:hypothetical protein
MAKRFAAVGFAVVASVWAAAAPSSAAVRRPATPSCDGAWHVVRSADHSHHSGEYDQLNGVAAGSSTNEWAVGSWSQYPDAYFNHTLIEHGNGKAWLHVPSPNMEVAKESQLYGVAVAGPDDVWAVGGGDQVGPPYTTLVEHWNGTAWSIVNDASYPGILYSVAAVRPNDIWAVGSANYPGRGLIEHWDGSAWIATYLPFSALLRGVRALGPDDIWAVGYRYNPASIDGDFTLTLHFDGFTWSRVDSPSPLRNHPEDQNWLTSVAPVASDDVWAVGLTRDLDWGTQDRPLAEHWDGSSWKIVQSPDPSRWLKNDFWGVAAVGANDVWAVGSHGIDPTTDPALAEHWDGTAWHVVPTPAGGQLLGIAVEPSATGISAVGNLNSSALTYLSTLAEHLCPA